MSTYYYLICEEHSQGVAACSSVRGGSPMGDGLLLPSFIYNHHSCDLRVVDEHDWKDMSIPGPYVRYIPED